MLCDLLRLPGVDDAVLDDAPDVRMTRVTLRGAPVIRRLLAGEDLRQPRRVERHRGSGLCRVGWVVSVAGDVVAEQVALDEIRRRLGPVVQPERERIVSTPGP